MSGLSSVQPVLALLVGAGAGLGLLLVIAGVRGTPMLPGGNSGSLAGGPVDPLDAWDGDAAGSRQRSGSREVGSGKSKASRIWIIAAVVGFVVWLVTAWPAIGILAGLAVGMAPRLFGGKAERKEWIAKTQAIAAWTEMLRDTMAAADGVEEAIAATVPIAPQAIRSEVATLDARRRSEQPLPEALGAFGAELDHPSADLVVAALAAAAQGEGSDFVAVLTRLAEMTRDEVRMRLRVEASRTKMHTSSMIIIAVIGLSVVLMVLVARDFFAAYSSFAGQLVLLLVGGILASGLMLMNRMSRIQMPERFSPRRGSRLGEQGSFA